MGRAERGLPGPARLAVLPLGCATGLRPPPVKYYDPAGNRVGGGVFA